MREKSDLENFQRGIDPAFVGNNDAQRVRRLPACLALGAHERVGQAEPDIVVRKRAPADENGVA